MPVVKIYEEIEKVKKINAEVDAESVYKLVVKSFEGYIWGDN